jgi:hypothetical protein
MANKLKPRRRRPYRGKTKAFRRFHDSLYRTSDLLEASEIGLGEKTKEFAPILEKLKAVPSLRGPAPKNYSPHIKSTKGDGDNINMELDGRSALLIKKAIRFAQVKHKALRFHLYSVLAVSLWGAFETYVVMMLEELFRLRPELLKSSEQITQAEAIDNKDSLVQFIAEKQLERVGHMVLSELLDYLKKRLGVSVSDSTAKQLREYYLIRNIIAHNTGLPRPKHLDALPDNLSVVNGEIRVTKSYLQSMVTRLEGSVAAVEKQVAAKFFSGSGLTSGSRGRPRPRRGRP